MNNLKKALVYWLYRLWTSTWRISLVKHPEVAALLAQNHPMIMAHWHGDALALIHLVRPYRLATMTSISRDGEIVDYVIRRLGGETSRGSSSRSGASALRGIIQLLKSGRIITMAVDGPRGPLHQVKSGTFEIARLGGARIIPVGVYAPKALQFERSWDKTYLPWPFTRVQIFLGKPLPPLSKQENPRSKELAESLGAAIHDATKQAADL
jgi:lysophospholipid acyltransferase (LPLAT)-like uncharacterized protein